MIDVESQKKNARFLDPIESKKDESTSLFPDKSLSQKDPFKSLTQRDNTNSLNGNLNKPNFYTPNKNSSNVRIII